MSERCCSFHRIKENIAFSEIRYEAGGIDESRSLFWVESAYTPGMTCLNEKWDIRSSCCQVNMIEILLMM